MSFTNLATRFACIVCLWILLIGCAFGDGVTVRELFVPESELPNLIDAVQQRVVLPRAEFEQLLRETQILRAELANADPATPPPVEAILQASSYAITIAEGRAVIDATLTIECLGKTKTPASVAIPLECAGVALLSALLERESEASEAIVAPLGFRDANNAILILSQPGTYTLTCRFTAPLTIDATQQRLAFTLPRGMATACSLRVPGDVELASGAAILSRNVTGGDTGSVTHFDLLLPPERATQLLLSLNSHRVGSYHALFARSVQFAEVTEQYQRLHATISLNERHQGVNSLEITVPEGFEVTDVGSTFLDSWNIVENTLTLTFRERVSGLTTVSLTAIKTVTAAGNIDENWQFPLFQPRDVVTHSAVLGLLVDQDLDRLAVRSRGLMAIDTMSLRAAIPASAMSPFPGSPTLRFLSAHYAPEVSGAKLNTAFRRPEVVVDATVNQTLTLTDGHPLLTADATVMPQTGRVFGTTISLPNTWRITRVVNASDNTELKFHHQEQETRIDFPHGVRSHETFGFLLTAVPRDDLSLLQTPQVEFPCLSVIGARNQTGRLVVQNRSEEDWEITASHTGAVTVADRTGTNDLIFNYTAVPLSLSLELAKRTGRATAKTIAFYRFTPTLVRIRYEVAFQINGATTRSLSCLLPSETPTTVSIVGLDGLIIKETFSEQVACDGEDSGWRRWRVELPRPMTGTLRLAIDFDLPLSLTGDTAKECSLLSVIAEGVAWQSHLVAIEGDEELDVAIPTEATTAIDPLGILRPVDTGLTAGATYTPGQRLLGVFATRSDLPAAVSLRLNALTKLPEAMIRQTTVTARLAAKLGVTYEARYDLQLTGGSLVFTFSNTNSNAVEFWGGDLDGVAIRPQRIGDDIVVPIPHTASNTGHVLRLFWWSPQQYNTQQHSKLTIPQVSTESRRVIPSLETVWQVIPPRGERVVSIGGERVTDSDETNTIPRIGETLATLGKTAFVSLVQKVVPMAASAPASYSETLSSAPSHSTSRVAPESYLAPMSDEKGVGLMVDSGEAVAFSSGDVATDEFRSADRKKDASKAMPPPAPPTDPRVTSFGRQPASEKAASRSRLTSAQPVSLALSSHDARPLVRFAVVGSRFAETLDVQLVDDRAASRWSIVIGCAVLLLGLGTLTLSRRIQAAFFFGTVATTLLIPLLTSLIPMGEHINPVAVAVASHAAILAACCVAMVAMAVALIRRVTAKITTKATAALLVSLVTLSSSSLIADETASDAPPLVIPAEAILVPYSLDTIPEGTLPDAASLTRPDQPLWVPYRTYLEMFELRAEKNAVKKPVPVPAIVPYSLDAVNYTVTTPQPTDTSLTLHSEMRLHVWVPEPVFIPLPLAGGALETPQLDGKPTICQSLSETQSLFRVEGIGEHRLTFAVRFRIDRQGGWRLVTGTLPTAIANKVSFITPQTDPLADPSSKNSNTKSDELWTNHTLDQRKWTLTPGEVIETSLPSTDPNSGSAFQWQWRLGMQGDAVDRSLEAESLIAVTLQEDGCWIDWTPTLKIGRGTWDAIRCAVPSDYTIVEIVGSNVRGWDVLANDIIDVEMLKPAEGNERFAIRLFKPLVTDKDKDKDTAWTWTLPAVSLPDAGLHRGRIDIRRSAVLQLRAAAMQGLAPTDLAESVPEFDSASPLGIVPFQSYRFHGDTKNITLEATPIVATQYVSVTSRLNIAQQITPNLTPKLRTIATVETTITFPPNPRPFEAVITLPHGFSLRQLRGDDGVVVVARTQDANADAVSVIDVLQANSTTASVSVMLAGDFHATAADDSNRLTSLPTFAVTTSDERPTEVQTTLFVLTDPALDAHIEKLTHGGQRALNDQRNNILPEERDWLRRAIEWRQTPQTPEPPTGEVVLSRRTPHVTCSTITNIRATNDALEETILLDFTIQNAGVRQVAFILPGSLRDATIDAPLLRRIKRTQIDAESILVELELQDAVMNQFRVLVRSDRRLDISTAYRITTPTVRDAQVTEQYVVLENDRRSLDEMTVTDPTRLQRLSRQQRPWSYLASMLGNNVTEAYCVNRDAESGDAANAVPSLIVPSLVVQMRRRETVRLAEARIDLAETRILCGDNGVYCAEQVYRIDNKKEPYLDLRLPPDATLWGASLFSAAAWANADRSAGIPVKPCQMPESVAAKYGNDSTQLVRIPLVKTESGDLDYVVRLVYAGTLPPFAGHSAAPNTAPWTPRDMPFVGVLNVPVGASIVRLSLPKTHRYQFDGNLQRVASDQQQQATIKIVGDYLRQQNARLDQVVQSGNSFAKSRAYSNQKQIEVMNSVASDGSTINISSSVSLGGRGYDTSGAVTMSGEEEGQASEANSSQLASQFYSQSNRRANDDVLRGRNDYASTQHQQPEKPEQSEKKESFDQRWFGANNLENNSGTMEPASAKREFDEAQTFNADTSTAQQQVENHKAAGRRGIDVTRGTIVLGEERQLSENTRRDKGMVQQQAALQALAPPTSLALGDQGVAVDQPRRQPIVMGGMAGVAGEGADGGLEIHGYSSSGISAGSGFGGGVRGGSAMGSSSGVALGEEFAGQMMPPANEPAPSQAPTDKLSGLATRTASLDIAIPDLADHDLYLFTTPQGSLELSLRATPRNTVARIASALLSLIALAACYGIYRLACKSLCHTTVTRRHHVPN